MILEGYRDTDLCDNKPPVNNIYGPSGPDERRFPAGYSKFV
jgi:hypothetical protein